ncbi:MAG: hypothetical protein FWD49_00265 [Firmicutes bacterium]|nr:hypothetical protein [Bacillota bacterium]
MSSRFTPNSKRYIGFLIVLAVAVIAIVSALLIMPVVLDYYNQQIPGYDANAIDPNRKDIEAIVLLNNGRIGVLADLSQVKVEIHYSNGEVETRSLTDLTVMGLNTSKPGEIDNVVLSFGGFTQTVPVVITPVTLRLTYVPAGPGGRVEGPAVQDVQSGENALTVRAVPDEGYEFSHWSDGRRTATRTDFGVSKSEDFTATFVKKRYLVIFRYPDGTSPREQWVFHGDPATMIPDIGRREMQLYGHRFTHWNVSNEEINSVTRDLIIIPSYERYATNVSLQITEGIEGLPLATGEIMPFYPKGVEADLRLLPNPYRTFAGWEVKDANNEWISLPMQTQNFGVVVSSVTAGGEHSRLALSFRTIIHSNGQYSVMFTTPGKQFGSSEPEPEMYIESLELRANLIYDTSELVFTSNNLPIHTNIISAGVPLIRLFSQTIVADPLVIFDAIKPNPVEGFEFKGWFMAGSEADASGNPRLITNATTFIRPTELIAHFEKLRYNLTFLNENSEVIRTVEFRYDDVLSAEGTFPNFTPAKENHVFIGWFVVGTNIVVNKEYRIHSNITAYPRFVVDRRDLTVQINGRGTASLSEDGGAFASVIGIRALDVTKPYLLRATADGGFVIAYYIIESSDGVRRVDIGATQHEIALPETGEIILSDYKITLFFRSAEHKLIIFNGSTPADSGLIEWQISENNTGHSENVNVEITVQDSASRNIWISAKTGYFIRSITVGGVPVSNLPQRAPRFTLVMEMITGEVVINVTYELIEFFSFIEQPAMIGGRHGGTITENTLNPYNVNKNPIFTIVANEGFFIKHIFINGINVNLFSPASQTNLSNIFIKGEQVELSTLFAGADERITSLRLEALNLVANFRITAEFAEIYYFVNVETVGVGSFSQTSAVAGFGQSVFITAYTTDDFYVHSYKIAEEFEVVLDFMSATETISVNGITNDITVRVEFRLRQFSVNFERAPNSFVSHGGGGRISLGSDGISYTFSPGQNVLLTVYALTGFYISSIEIAELGAPSGRLEFVLHNSTEHTLTINNLRKSYTVRVTASPLNFEVKLGFSGSVNAVSGDIPKTVLYGTEWEVVFLLEANRRILAESVEVRNFNNQLLPTTTIPEILGSILTTVSITPAGGGLRQFRVTVDRITEDVEIFIPIGYEEPIGDDMILTMGAKFGSIRVAYTNPDGSILNYFGSTSPSSGNEETGSGTVTMGSRITFYFSPQDINLFSLKYFTVNGVRVQPDHHTYTIENVRSSIHVYVVFEQDLFIIGITSLGRGVVSANKDAFEQNDANLELRIAPGAGQRLVSLFINDINYDSIVESTNQGVITHRLPSVILVANISVHAVFEPITLSFLITLVHPQDIIAGGIPHPDYTSGVLSQRAYGDGYRIPLEAIDGYHIESIIVDGRSVDSRMLDQFVMDGRTYRITYGILSGIVYENTNIVVTFAPNRYSVSLIQTQGGRTQVALEDGAPTSNSDLQVLANGRLLLMMQANLGWHISKVFINYGAGEVELPDSEWKADDVNPNNNALVNRWLSGIDARIVIRVVYAINVYSVSYTISNSSPNFRNIDTNASDFGLFEIFGLPRFSESSDRLTGVYRNISYGQNLRFVARPVILRGYHVSLFRINWIDPELGHQSETRTFSATNQMIYNGVRADLVIEIEFTRDLFEFSAGAIPQAFGSPFAFNGSVSIALTNPMNGAPAEAVGGKQEFGIAYNVVLNAGTGYTLSALFVNGADRTSTVRQNRVSAEIRSDLNLEAFFRISTYTITLNANQGEDGETTLYLDSTKVLERVYENGEWIMKWAGGDADRIVTASGFVERIGNSATQVRASHNANLRLQADPDSANGYRTENFSINGIGLQLTDSQRNQRYQHNFIATSAVPFSITYRMRTFEVTLVYSQQALSAGIQGGSYSVDFGGTVVIENVITEYGYYLSPGDIRVSVNNGIILPNLEFFGAWAGLGFDIRNVESAVRIEFLHRRTAYNISFDGDYKSEHSVQAGAKANAISGAVLTSSGSTTGRWFTEVSASHPITQNSVSWNGSVIYGSDISGSHRGAWFGDSLNIYLIPVTGYEISSVSVIIRNAFGQGDSVVVSATYATIGGDQRISYDTANRYYVIPVIGGVSGNIEVAVTYRVKTYDVTVLPISGGEISFFGDIQTSDSGQLFIQHHARFNIVVRAQYGRHLSLLTVNGARVASVYSIIDPSFVYEYHTFDLAGLLEPYISEAFLHELSTLTIQAQFGFNSFDVEFSVNGNRGGDSTLQPFVPNSTIAFNVNGTPNRVTQTPSEGYRITAISITNALGDILYTPSADEISATFINLFASGKLIDLLDFHSQTNRTVFISYTTQIISYTSHFETWLYREGLAPVSTPFADIFTLTAEFGGNQSASGLSHNYFTPVTLTFAFTNQEAYDNYYFAGFMEEIEGVWVYVRGGLNGINLPMADGTMLTYTVSRQFVANSQSGVLTNRKFRAVVFQVYNVDIEVHPEYKFAMGSFANNTIRYTQYSNVAVRASYNAGSAPDITDGLNSELINLINSDININGRYSYRVLSGARLNISAQDSYTGSNRSDANPSLYFVEYKNDLISNSQTLIPNRLDAGTIVGGVNRGITGDSLIHVYFANTMNFSFRLESVGAVANPGEGGTVSVNGSSVSASQRVMVNTVATITVQARDNYRFDDILFHEFLPNAGADGFRRPTNNWISLSQMPNWERYVRFEYHYEDGTSSSGDKDPIANKIVNRVVITVFASENMEFTVRFWKRISVQSSVVLFSDNEGNLPWEGNKPHFTESPANGNYDFDSEIAFRLPYLELVQTSTWDVRYQFVGYTVNGINTFRHLGGGFPQPQEYTALLRLTDQGAFAIPIASLDGKFVVDVKAVFVPILNITLENSYPNPHYDSNPQFDAYFNPGMIQLAVPNYTMSWLGYLPLRRSVSAQTQPVTNLLDRHNNTAFSFQVPSRINRLDPNVTSSLSPYNIWNDNVLTLSWLDVNGPEAGKYSTIFWEYYEPNQDGTGGEWKRLPGLSTRPSYTITVSELLKLSYFNRANESAFYEEDLPMWNSANSYIGAGSFATLRLRARFNRVERIDVVPWSALSQSGVYIEGADGPTPQITENGRSWGNFDFNSTITVRPVPNGLRFDYWTVFNPSTQTYEEVTYDGAITGSHFYRIDRVSNVLTVRMAESYLFAPRYTRIYNATITAQNLSANSDSIFHRNYTPGILFFGFGKTMELSNWNLNAPPQPQASVSRQIEVGDWVCFKLDNPHSESTFGSKVHGTIAGTYTRFLSVYYLNEANQRVTINPHPSYNHSDIYQQVFVVQVTQRMTVYFEFKSFTSIEITNLYHGDGSNQKSVLFLPERLRTATGLSEQINVSGTSVLIENVPIERDSAPSNYSGTFINKLNGMFTGFSGSQTIEFRGGYGLFLSEVPALSARTYGFFAFGSVSEASAISRRAYPFQDSHLTQAGMGTPQSPFRISSVSHLDSMEFIYTINNRTFSTTGGASGRMHFILTASFTLSPSGALFQSRGLFCDSVEAGGDGFNGVFMGNNQTLTLGAMSANALTNDRGVGIFARLGANGQIRDLVIQRSATNISLGGNNNVGLLVARAVGTSGNIASISNIRIGDTVGIIQGNGSNVGGLVGFAEHCTITGVQVTNVTVRNSSTAGFGTGGIVGTLSTGARLVDSFKTILSTAQNVESQGSHVGGAVGRTTGTAGEAMLRVTVNYFTSNNSTGASIGTLSSSVVGGVIGLNGVGRTISQVYATGSFTINSRASTGITGNSAPTMTQNAEGNLTTVFGAGGIAGENRGTITYAGLGISLGFGQTWNTSNEGTNGLHTVRINSNYAGGIVGVNRANARLEYSNTGNHRFFTNFGGLTSVGGAYGAHVAINQGTVIYAHTVSAYNNQIIETTADSGAYTTGALPNDYLFTLVRSLPMGGNNGTWYPFYNVVPNSSNRGTHVAHTQETGAIYFGGVAGFNSGGLVSNSSIRGKLQISRTSGSNGTNYTFHGGIVGMGGTVSGCVLNGVVTITHMSVNADANPSPVPQFVRVGNFAGRDASVQSSGGTVNFHAIRIYHASGTVRTQGSNGTFLIGGATNDSGFRTAIINELTNFQNIGGTGTGSNARDIRTTASLPTGASGWAGHLTEGWYNGHRYTGFFRQIAVPNA